MCILEITEEKKLHCFLCVKDEKNGNPGPVVELQKVKLIIIKANFGFYGHKKITVVVMFHSGHTPCSFNIIRDPKPV